MASAKGNGRVAAFALASEARRAGLAVQQELAGRSLKGQLKQADRVGARYVAILGDEGIALKDMESGEQEVVDSAVGRRGPHAEGTSSGMKQPPAPNIYRDAWAGDLRADRCGTEVRVAGWVHRRRDHGGLIFIDLRDRSGDRPARRPPAGQRRRLRASPRTSAPSTCCRVEGEVVKRAAENVNPNLPTGEIEIHVRSLRRLATSETPPFPVDEDVPVDENTRLRHRMIDLRRERMRDALTLRHEVTRAMRDTLARPTTSWRSRRRS